MTALKTVGSVTNRRRNASGSTRKSLLSTAARVDPSQQLAREDGDSPQEPAGLVMEEWQLVAGDVDRGLELTLEEKPPVDRLLVSAEDVLAGAVRLLYAVLRQLAQPLVGQIGEDRDPAQLAGVHQCAFRY